MPEPLKIVSAMYGAVGSDKDLKDVTSKIRDLVSSDGSGISIIVSPETIKITDPAPQSQKQLIVKYKFGEKGDPKKIITLDGATLSLYASSLPPTSGVGNTAAFYAMIWKNVMFAAGMFGFVLSIAFAYSLAANGGYGSWILFVGIAFMMPYMGVGGLVFVVLLHTAITGKFVAFEPTMFQRGVTAVRSAFSNLRSRVANVIPPLPRRA
jgi:hypothetical protein